MPELTYAQLAKATVSLSRDITRSAEAIRVHAKTIDDEAKDTTRVAESVAAMKVDSATVAETREVGRIMAGLSEAVLAYATTANDTASAAQAAHDQNKASHSRIGEAMSRSPIGREVYDVDNTWLTQE